jgi:hypothetical protein
MKEGATNRAVNGCADIDETRGTPILAEVFNAAAGHDRDSSL